MQTLLYGNWKVGATYPDDQGSNPSTPSDTFFPICRGIDSQALRKADFFDFTGTAQVGPTQQTTCALTRLPRKHQIKEKTWIKNENIKTYS